MTASLQRDGSSGCLGTQSPVQATVRLAGTATFLQGAERPELGSLAPGLPGPCPAAAPEFEKISALGSLAVRGAEHSHYWK